MPAPLLDAAGWAAVRDTAAQVGIRAAARLHGVTEDSARQRAKRDGDKGHPWPDAAHVGAAAAALVSPPRVPPPVTTTVTSPVAIAVGRASGILTMQERREILTRVARRQAPSSRRVVTAPDGQETVTEETDVIPAILAEARLAGELIERQEIAVAGTILQLTPEDRARKLREVIEWERQQSEAGGT